MISMMKRNFLLFLAFFFVLVLIVNSSRRLSQLASTSKKVENAEKQLEELRRENEVLKRELEYKQSAEFAEGEIRNKLGLAREGEAVVILPKKDDEKPEDERQDIPNYVKWWDLFFRS